MAINGNIPIPPEISAILNKKKKQNQSKTTNANAPEPKPKKTEKKSSGNIYEFVIRYVQNDVLELFGETGSGKTTFSLIFSKEASYLGLNVLYIDTERNLQKEPDWCDYRFIAKYSDILEFIKEIMEIDYDIIIIDSIGMPVLGHFALMNMKERGEALLGVQAILYQLKNFCYKDRKRMALVTNQPESEFGKSTNTVLRPFGDKGQFFTKEIWRTKKVYSKPSETLISIDTFRSRFAGMGKKIAEMKITDKFVEFRGYDI